jgi:hypothetical protein
VARKGLPKRESVVDEVSEAKTLLYLRYWGKRSEGSKKMADYAKLYTQSTDLDAGWHCERQRLTVIIVIDIVVDALHKTTLHECNLPFKC